MPRVNRNTSPRRPALAILPEEVWALVVEYTIGRSLRAKVSPDDGRRKESRVLLILQLVCRTLHVSGRSICLLRAMATAQRSFLTCQDLSTPHLFAHACFYSPRKLNRFFTILRRYPSKAALVRTLSGHPDLEMGLVSVLACFVGDVPRLPNVVALGFLRYISPTFTCINLLLAKCPNLEELELFWNGQGRADVPRLQLAALPRLRSLKLSGFLHRDTFLFPFFGNPAWASSSLVNFELDRADCASRRRPPPPLPFTLLSTFLGWVGPNLTSFIIKNAPFPSSLVTLCPAIKVLGLRDLNFNQPPFPSLHHQHVTTVHLSRPAMHVLFQGGELATLKRCLPALAVVRVDLWMAIWAEVNPDVEEEPDYPDWIDYVDYIDAADVLCRAAGLELQGAHGRQWVQSGQWRDEDDFEVMIKSF